MRRRTVALKPQVKMRKLTLDVSMRKRFDPLATGEGEKVDPQEDHAKKIVDPQATGGNEKTDHQDDLAKKKADAKAKEEADAHAKVRADNR